MIKAELLQQLTESRDFLSEKIEKWMLSQLVFILAIAEFLALLLKVQGLIKKSRRKLVFKWREDYEARYGEHSTGPFYEVNESGKNKLTALGLTEEEICLLLYARYYDYERFDYSPLRWIIEPENGIRKRDIGNSIELVRKNLDYAIGEWNERLAESPYLKPSAEFLLSLLPEEIVKEVFGDAS